MGKQKMATVVEKRVLPRDPGVDQDSNQQSFSYSKRSLLSVLYFLKISQLFLRKKKTLLKLLFEIKVWVKENPAASGACFKALKEWWRWVCARSCLTQPPSAPSVIFQQVCRTAPHGVIQASLGANPPRSLSPTGSMREPAGWKLLSVLAF